MITRKGKIARLPLNIRETLNLRLQDGEPASAVVGWLNSLPEVQHTLAQHFHGRPINEQNLCDWKQGGLRDWEEAEEESHLTLLLTENFGSIREKLGDREPAECLIPQLVVQLYRLMRKSYDTDFSDPADERRFFKICDRVMRLRAFEQKDAKISLDRERASFTAGIRRALPTVEAHAREQLDSARDLVARAAISTAPTANRAATVAPAQPNAPTTGLASTVPAHGVNQSKSKEIKDQSTLITPNQPPVAHPAVAATPSILKSLPDPRSATYLNSARNPLVGRITPLQPTFTCQPPEFSTAIAAIPAAAKRNIANIFGLSFEAFESALGSGAILQAA